MNDIQKAYIISKEALDTITAVVHAEKESQGLYTTADMTDEQLDALVDAEIKIEDRYHYNEAWTAMRDAEKALHKWARETLAALMDMHTGIDEALSAFELARYHPSAWDKLTELSLTLKA